MSEKVYPEGLVGRKIGMTQVFTAEGQAQPVTVVEIGPCCVLDVKQSNTHGYNAVQLGFMEKKPQRVNRAEMGHFKRAGKGAFYHVKEIRCDVERLGWTMGDELKVADVFAEGEFVDVTGQSIGRGFSGVVRKFRVRGQPATRGTHEKRRNIGAIGCRKFPGRVLKNQKMPGHHGDKRVTIQNLRVVGVRAEDNLLLVKGAIPGAKGSVVTVCKAVKRYTPAEPKPAKEAA